MAILYNPLKGKLICIDEPEIGLHPDMIYNVGHAIKDAALASTIVISTHSAELLNTFDLDRVLVFEKDEENLTSVSTFTEAGFQGWYDSFMPGDMWRAGDIGGKRW